MDDSPGKTLDFLQLRRSGARPGAGLLLGTVIGRIRDALAAAMATVGVSPNALTWAGLVMAMGAGACLAVGAGHRGPWSAEAAGSWWPIAGGLLLLASAVVDMLDGALARAGRTQSDYGALLDSALDRLGDVFVFAGCAAHFALSGNATLVLLSALAAGGAVIVSYVKARAENFVNRCSVGYWQRGERLLVFTAAAVVGHVPAGLWLLGLGPWCTVARRLRHGLAVVSGRQSHGGDPLALWRYPRGSLGYDVWTLGLLLFLLLAPLAHPALAGGADPVGAVLRRLSGG